MKKRFLLLASAILMMFFFAGTASAYLTYGANQMGFINYENVFDNQGIEKTAADFLNPDRQLTVGDFFVGIISIDKIADGLGNEQWIPSAGDRLVGVFAQEVMAIDVDTDTNDTRLTLGAASLTEFETSTGEKISTGLSNNEMFAIYADDAPIQPGGTTLKNSFDGAKDGNLWLTLGYDNGTDDTWGTGDDDGYFYSYVSPIGTSVENFRGDAWGGLNMIQNNTGWTYTGINNSDENEVSGPVGTIPNLMTDWYLESKLKTNEPWKDGLSPWIFESDDPAHTNVVPEPGTLFLLGLGLIGVAGIGRRRVQ